MTKHYVVNFCNKSSRLSIHTL